MIELITELILLLPFSGRGGGSTELLSSHSLRPSFEAFLQGAGGGACGVHSLATDHEELYLFIVIILHILCVSGGLDLDSQTWQFKFSGFGQCSAERLQA